LRYRSAADRGLGREFTEENQEMLSSVAREATRSGRIHKDLCKLNLRRFQAFAIIYEVVP
jgi:hypothetical protein